MNAFIEWFDTWSLAIGLWLMAIGIWWYICQVYREKRKAKP